MCRALVVTFIVQTILFTMAAVVSTTIFLYLSSPSSNAAVVKSDLLMNITEDTTYGGALEDSCVSPTPGDTKNCSESGEEVYCCRVQNLQIWFSFIKGKC